MNPKRLLARSEGVTLVEMMVVVVILGILATVSTLIITTIFNANIQGGQMLDQRATIQTANNFLEARLAPAAVGSVGQTTTGGDAVSASSIGGDQFVFTASGTCYRLIYLDQANAIEAVTQPVDPSTNKCKRGSTGISPARGPTETAPADPVLDAIDASTGGLKQGATLPNDASAFVLASNVQKLGGSGAPPFSYCTATCTQTIPVDPVAKATSTTSWYGNPSNLGTVASLQMQLNVLGSKPGTKPTVAAKLYSQQIFLGNGSGGTLASTDGTDSAAFHARLATSTPLPANTNSGGVLTASSPGPIGKIDGQDVHIGDRVLVTGETNASKNGVYDVVDVGTANGPPVTVSDGLASLQVLDPLNRSENPLSNGGKWSVMSFGGTQVYNGNSTPTKVTISATGSDSASGWTATSAGGVSGAFWNGSTYSGSGSNQGTAAALTFTRTSCSGGVNRYVALWINLPAPTSGQSGYEVQFNCTGSSSGSPAVYTSNIELDKWVLGSKTLLKSVNGQAIPDGSQLAITALNGTIAVYMNSGSGWTQLLSAADTTFTSGYAGIMGSGSNGLYTNFKAGTFTTSPGASGAPWKLARATGADTTTDYLSSGTFAPGSLVTVSEGSQNSSSIWQLQPLTPSSGWTLNSDPQTFVIKAGANSVGSTELKDSSVNGTKIQNGSVAAADLGYATQPIAVCFSGVTNGSQDLVWGQPQAQGVLLPLTACGASLPTGVALNQGSYPGWCSAQQYGTCTGTYVTMNSNYISNPNQLLLVTMTYDMQFNVAGTLVGQLQAGNGGMLGSVALGAMQAGQRGTFSQTQVLRAADLPGGATGAPYAVGMDLWGSVQQNWVYMYHTRMTIVPLPY